MSLNQILIVEDDPQMAEILSHQIMDLGYSFDWVNDGRAGLEKALEHEYLLVVLDLGLPGIGGKEICRLIRQKRTNVPILIVTGESGEASTVVMLELGADDYITKPIRPLEFRARVGAVLRRTASLPANIDSTESVESSPKMILYRDIKIDLALQKVFASDANVDLSKSEYELLLVFLENRGRVLSRDQVVKALWGQSNYSYEQNIRTTISRLRIKLEKLGKRAPYIVSQRGFGYRLANEDE